MLRNFAGGVLYVLALYFCATFGTIFLMGPTLPLLWLRPRWFRWINDRLIMWWLLLPPVSELKANLIVLAEFFSKLPCFIVFHKNRFSDCLIQQITFFILVLFLVPCVQSRPLFDMYMFRWLIRRFLVSLILVLTIFFVSLLNYWLMALSYAQTTRGSTKMTGFFHCLQASLFWWRSKLTSSYKQSVGMNKLLFIKLITLDVG